MTILIVAEMRDGRLHPATLNALGAAGKLASELHVLVADSRDGAAASALASIPEVARVRCLSAAHYREQNVENLAIPLAQMASAYTHVLFAATPFGKSLAPRLAAMLGVALVSDVVEILDDERFVRPIYAGKLLTTVRSEEPVKLLSIRPSAFVAAACGNAVLASIDEAPSGPEMGVSRLLQRESVTHGDRPSLAEARVVVAGGRGLASRENFLRLIHPLAEQLGAAIGASRAAVDAGFAPHDWQVGQTGYIVAPELYIAIGLSGAAQHLAGIRGSRVIVAINSDPEAAIVQMADYSLIGDLNVLTPELITSLVEKNSHQKR